MTAKSPAFRIVVFLLLVCAIPAGATTFIMPTDEEMIARSQRIVIGTAQSSYVRERNGSVETVYTFSIERSLKGGSAEEPSLTIVSPGGALAGRGVIVPSAAHFAVGERVLLFLTQQHGEWTPTDLTLGKFRFVTSNKGDRLLTRDLEDVAGWERDGSAHVEKVRREEPFLRYIRERIKGREIHSDEQSYLVDPSSVVLAPVEKPGARRVQTDVVYTAGSYTMNVTCFVPDCNPQEGPHPSRWDTFPSAVTFHKKNDQNIAGAVDGGVSVIQSGLAAWTNDCGSNVNLVYGGTTTTPSANFDSVHVVEFNDPQGRVGGVFGVNSSTIAITFISYIDVHTALSETWWSIGDADVVFNDGFTAANSSFNTAMSHELGHAIGWRHSNASTANGAAQTVTCNSANEDCTPTNTAIMFWQANPSFGFTLQPWDINAVRAVYPSSCVSLSPPTNVVATATGGTTVDVTWTAAAGATGYKVYRSTNNSTFGVVGTPASSPFTDNTASANTAYTYKVTATDATPSESGFSNADFATTVVFTDPTLTAESTLAKAAHVTELRTAVNALRTLNGGQSAFAFTDPTLDSTVLIKAVHMTELQTQLNTVRTALGFSTATFTETPTAGTTLVKKLHVDELRTGVQ